MDRNTLIEHSLHHTLNGAPSGCVEVACGAFGNTSGACDFKNMNFNTSQHNQATTDPHAGTDECHAGDSTLAKQTLRQSLYIAALDRYLGIRGLISPFHDAKSGLSYDFFHPESKQLVKIFTTLEPAELLRYPEAHCRDNTLYIIDAENFASRMRRGSRVIMNDESLVKAAKRANALIYHKDCFWREYDGGDAAVHWDPLWTDERQRCVDAIYRMND